MRKKTALTVILCLCAAVFAVCAVFIVKSFFREAPSEDEFKTNTEASEAPVTEKAYVSPIDFEKLWEINPDVIGWITIPGTDIDYPILYCREDNAKYLETNINGEEDISGSIYIENYNHSDFSDFNTVIYGHNMRAGTMFAQLHRYEDRDFFFANSTVHIYLPDRELTYKIFASRIISNRHILSVCKNSDTESCEAYLRNILAGGNLVLDETAKVSTDDRILSLATCWVNTDYRYVVYAVLQTG